VPPVIAPSETHIPTNSPGLNAGAITPEALQMSQLHLTTAWEGSE